MTTKQDAYAMTITHFQEMTDKIFKEKDARDYINEDFVIHLMRRQAAISEGIRKDSKEELLEAIPVFFIWLLSFCNRMEINLEEAVWDKYHGCCPNCGATKNCGCITTEKKPKTWFSNSEAEMPSSLVEWQKMFFHIYSKINNHTTLDRTFSHLSEEIGEVSGAFLFYKYRNGSSKEKENLRNELADVFAQLIAVCNHIHLNVIDLAKITYAKYPDRCDVCKETTCTCKYG